MLLGRVEGLRRRDHAEECAERVVVLGRYLDAADALDVDGVAEAHVAELGDGPAEAVVVDGLRSYYRFDIVRGRVRRTVFRFRDSPGCGDAFLPIVAPRRTMWYSPCEVPGADSRGAGSMSKMRHPEKPVWTNLHVLAQRMGPRGAEATRNRRRAT